VVFLPRTSVLNSFSIFKLWEFCFVISFKEDGIKNTNKFGKNDKRVELTQNALQIDGEKVEGVFNER